MELGVDAAAIHGDLPQVARERALRRFAEGQLKVPVATDVAARGLDIDDVGAVLHYAPASDAKDYLLDRSVLHGPSWPGRLGDHARRVQPAHPDADPPAHPPAPLEPAFEVFSNDQRLRYISLFAAASAG